MTPIGGKATAYVCRQYVCQTPITDPKEMEKTLNEPM